MEHVGLSQSLISHHLKDLREAGMVSNKKRGLRVYYSLTIEGQRVTETIFSLTEKEVNV
jgi:DNA-binding transcriptional ArsR family regulator